jgi:predicted DNA-binding protein
MLKNDKRVSDLKAELTGKDEDKILSAIENLRGEKPFRGAIELLAEIHSAGGNHLVREAIEKFMNDLKEPSLAPDIINLIDRIEPGETRTAFIASCWQSGTDYSPFIEYFVKWSMSGDYGTILECLTVIEQWAPSLPASDKKRFAEILGPEKNRDNQSDQLLNEIRLLLIR